MVKNWDDCVEEAGGYPEPVINQYGYWAYKNGEVTSFDTRKEADNHSPRVESYVKNKEDVKEYNKKYSLIRDKAYDIWYASVRKEHSEISDAVFSICMEYAYERGNSAGYDEVANYMNECVEFANRILTVK